MPIETSPHHPPIKRILGRVAHGDFVGRSVELFEITSLALRPTRRGLIVLAEPASGVTELLRQAYDKLFAEREREVAPIYFAWSQCKPTVAGAARQFLQTFLTQFIAYRRQEPALVNTPLTLNVLAGLSLPADSEWIARLVENYERARASGDDEGALVRLCLSAPQTAAAHGTRTIVLFDDMHAIENLRGEIDLSAESARVSLNAETPYVYAGLRRRLLDVLNGEIKPHRLDNFGTLHVKGLDVNHARRLVDLLAGSLGVALSEETRDLIVQQFAGSPLLINAFLEAAQRRGVSLETFRDCQRLYVDELLGGRIHRRFNAVLEKIAPAVTTRRALVRALHESSLSAPKKSPVEAWRSRLELGAEGLDALMSRLHMYELASINATLIEVAPSLVWRDYLRANYRLQSSSESRALVVAESITESLKRAPQTMERHYRRERALGLRELLAHFDNQRVPASLFHDERFNRLYRGMKDGEIADGLNAETELLRLPQIVHTASGASFHPAFTQLCDEERCVVAHGFDATTYTDANEVVWMAVEIESKVEAGRALAEVWYERLTQLAAACGFKRTRFWFVSPEGFSTEAAAFLSGKEALSSGRQQLELLTSRLCPLPADAAETVAETSHEFEMVIPMGGDTELIAAQAVEQIARRLNFQPEQINQIKHALIEACINATENSLSPDRKIYQRFHVEDDKLVVTVSSRGAVAPAPITNNGEAGDEPKGRRGWGLKLIRTLMDEVEFERAGDGTRLRMAKYLRQ